MLPPALCALLLLQACAPRILGTQDTAAPAPPDSPTPEGTCPVLYVSATELTWPSASLDGTDPLGVTVANLCSGEGDLLLVNTLSPSTSSAFSFEGGQATLAPAAVTTLTVRFQPLTLGDHEGALQVATNAVEDGILSIQLHGTALSDGDHDDHGSLAAGGDDCDDRDPAIHPDAPEAWYDQVDNDCDGYVDVLDTSSARAWVRGGSEGWLGYPDGLSLGDLDGDGLLEIIAGGLYSGTSQSTSGQVWILPQPGEATWGGPISSSAVATVQGSQPENYLGHMDPRQGDVNGDGIDDLFLGASDAHWSEWGNLAGGLFVGGTLEGGLTLQDAAIRFTGSTSYYSLTASSHLDMDGDGLADLFYGDWYSGDSYPGHVYALLSSSLVPGSDMELARDADADWYGADEGDSLGCTIGGGDLDGDGYQDLVLTAPQARDEDDWNGEVYLVPGASRIPPSGSVESRALARIRGTSEEEDLGYRGIPQVVDLDRDGSLDLVLSSPGTGTVYAWFGAGELRGQVQTDAAHVLLTGSGPREMGLSLASGDLDGDGSVDLLVSAPDGRDLDRDEDEPGEVYAWRGADLVHGSFTTEEAALFLRGASVGDLFGFALAVGDLDGDGRDGLLVAAPGAGSQHEGQVWLFTSP